MHRESHKFASLERREKKEREREKRERERKKRKNIGRESEFVCWLPCAIMHSL